MPKCELANSHGVPVLCHIRVGRAILLLPTHNVKWSRIAVAPPKIANDGGLISQWHTICVTNSTRQEENEDSDDSGGSTDDAWGLLRRACHYFESGSFQWELEHFRREHANTFVDAVGEEGKIGEHTHTMRYTELHKRYLELVETLLTEFLKEEGRTAEELFSDMKDAKQNNYTALFEEHQYHGFVQSVLDAMEYESFYRLMLTAAATTSQADNITGGGGERDGPGRRRVEPRRQKCGSPRGSTSGGDSDTGSSGTERDSGRGGHRSTRK